MDTLDLNLVDFDSDHLDVDYNNHSSIDLVVDIEQLYYFFVVVAVVLPDALLLDHRSILPEKVD